jgi:3-hydroxyacyl-CoA dehydrogenase
VQRVAVIGAGVIGASWAALFLARGLDVTVSDPDPATAERLREAIESWWPSLERQHLVVAGADPGRWRIAAGATEAAADVDFVQESGPERLATKHDLLGAIDAVAGPDVVIASSSSGLMASDLQKACVRHPERIVVGHPFHPPHLIPLVEVVGGGATSDDVIARALDFYRSVGKRPIHVRVELPGHVTNRLQAALWREAYWLVEQGVCSVADIDLAISSGPGPRWALLGPFATQHLSGGTGGLAHVLEHLGPPMVAWWDDFVTPALDDELRRTVVAGVADELADIDQDEMVAERDRLLEALLVAKGAASHLPGSRDLWRGPTT